MLIAALGQYFFGITIFVSSMFLIMLVLVQRGRGGGLAGALGGPGGQSAFGTKAGDLFTRITIVVAALWIFLCASAVFFLKAKKFTTTGGSTNAAAAGSIGSDDEPDAGTLPLTGESTTGAAQPGLDLMNLGTEGSGDAEISDLPSINLEPSAPETPAATDSGEGDVPVDPAAAEEPPAATTSEPNAPGPNAPAPDATSPPATADPVDDQ